MPTRETVARTLARVIVQCSSTNAAVLAGDIAAQIRASLTVDAFPSGVARTLERVARWNTETCRRREDWPCARVRMFPTVVPTRAGLAGSKVQLTSAAIDALSAGAGILLQGHVGSDAGTIVLARLKLIADGTRGAAISADITRILTSGRLEQRRQWQDFSDCRGRIKVEIDITHSGPRLAFDTGHQMGRGVEQG